MTAPNLAAALQRALDGIDRALTYMPAGICVAARELLEKQAADIRDTLARIAEVDGS
jgi:hypothetical protein